MNYFIFRNKKSLRGDLPEFMNHEYNEDFESAIYDNMLSPIEYEGYLEDYVEEVED